MFSGVGLIPRTIIRLYMVSRICWVPFMFPVLMLATGIPNDSARAANGPEEKPTWAAATLELGNWVIRDSPWFWDSSVRSIPWFWIPALDIVKAAIIGWSRPPTAYWLMEPITLLRMLRWVLRPP